ncbi:MAG: hypothetical protein GWN86_12650, partial [Desulfobacterales bacterium]|nr:hypothetical protein [Desulfobacterales bacterium]
MSNYCDLEENPWARHSKRIMGLKYHPDEQGIWTTDLTLMLLKKATEPYMLVRKLEDVGVELPPVQEIEV